MSNTLRLLAFVLLSTTIAGCATLGTQTVTSDEATCAAIKRSPPYSGKKLRAAVGEKFRKWTATTNGTLDRLKCPDE